MLFTYNLSNLIDDFIDRYKNNSINEVLQENSRYSKEFSLIRFFIDDYNNIIKDEILQKINNVISNNDSIINFLKLNNLEFYIKNPMRIFFTNTKELIDLLVSKILNNNNSFLYDNTKQLNLELSICFDLCSQDLVKKIKENPDNEILLKEIKEYLFLEFAKKYGIYDNFKSPIFGDKENYHLRIDDKLITTELNGLEFHDQNEKYTLYKSLYFNVIVVKRNNLT